MRMFVCCVFVVRLDLSRWRAPENRKKILETRPHNRIALAKHDGRLYIVLALLAAPLGN